MYVRYFIKRNFKIAIIKIVTKSSTGLWSISLHIDLWVQLQMLSCHPIEFIDIMYKNFMKFSSGQLNYEKFFYSGLLVLWFSFPLILSYLAIQSMLAEVSQQ